MDQNVKTVLVSIIMPAYNAEKYIAESIASAQRQTFRDWELIVIDDGSTDSTAEIVKGLQQNDERIIYVHQQNKKLPAARNCGIKLSKGQYVAFLDSDDLWLPEKLERQLEAFEKQKADLVFTDGFILKEKTQELIPYPTVSGFFTGEEMYRIEYFSNLIPVLSVLIKKDWLNKIGHQDETLIFGCEDWDYWLRMARNGATFYGMPEKLFKYRVHDGGMSRKIAWMKLAEFTVLYHNIDYRYISKREIYKRLAYLIFSKRLISFFLSK